MELHGEHVTLRPLLDGDVVALAAIAREPDFSRWWPGLDEEALRAKVTGVDGVVPFAIVHAGEVAGFAQYYEEDDPEFRHAGIDLGLGGRWRDRGLGTDAVRTLAKHLVHERRHHRLVIDPAADNERAIRCYEKAGFRAVGVLREYQRAADGTWRDGLLMEALARELT